MPRKPRAYRPKTRGCFECSKRRICCDRTEPQCQKCFSKGLVCSGLGIRHRFSQGVAARGFWVGKTIQEVYDGKIDSRKRAALIENLSPNRDEDPAVDNVQQDSATSGLEAANVGLSNETFALEVDLQENDGSSGMLTSQDDDEQRQMMIYASSGYMSPASQPSASRESPWVLALILHFSSYIACEMVAIDGQHNGWRHIVLPIAHSEGLVRNAVLAASSFHLASRRNRERLSSSSSCSLPLSSPVGPGSLQATPGFRTEPAQLYIKTIMDLQQRFIRRNDREKNLVTLLTILTLLVTAMVTGSDDFPMLFRLLDSAMEVIGGERNLGDSELARFVIRQICKMRVYAAPLLSEDAGVATLSSETNIARAFECLRHCSEQRPDFTTEASIIQSLIQQSYDIYLRQATQKLLPDPYLLERSTLHDGESVCRVQQFIDTFQSFPSQSSGMQVLIWATFVAASASVLDEHRSFFLRVFRDFYSRSGFKNVSRGAKHLQIVWDLEITGERWVSLLPQANVFVM